MIEALFSSPNYQAARRMMDATVTERAAIGTNIANLETPGYKRLQLEPSFRDHLQEAAAAGDVESMHAVSPAVAEDPLATATRLDGNTVVMERELMDMMRNSVDHAFESQLLTGNLLRLRMAITGRSA